MNPGSMNVDELRRLAEQIAAGRLGVEEFVAEASRWGVADLGDARVDLDRRRRCGFPEVVYGERKSAEQIERIFRALLADGPAALATRVNAEQAAHLQKQFPQGTYNPAGRTFRIGSVTFESARFHQVEGRTTGGRVVVVTAGTTDLCVAEEARETLLWMGIDVELIQDVGVAGPQRLIAELPRLRGADAVVVVAGMEAALTSVVGGYVDCPVIGVPTSVGYGANLAGLTALLGMASSCAANVTVVNIDAGFKAGYVAGLIAARARHE